MRDNDYQLQPWLRKITDDAIPKVGTKNGEHFLGSLLLDSLENKATAIHIDWDHQSLRLRYRIEEKITQRANLPVWNTRRLVRLVTHHAMIDSRERRRPTCGEIVLKLKGKTRHANVDFIPSGRCITIRWNIRTHRSLEDMDLLPSQVRYLNKVLQNQRGMFVCSGYSPIGDFALANALAQQASTDGKRAISIEWKPKAAVSGITQCDCSKYRNVDWLRVVLRQQPDVLVVDLPSDEVDLKYLCRVASEQCLVLVVSRRPMYDWHYRLRYYERVSLSHVIDCLIGGIHQLNLRAICSECATVYQPNQAELDFLRVRCVGSGLRFAKSLGCGACRGIAGPNRMVFEAHSMSPQLVDHWHDKDNWTSARSIMVQAGMTTMYESAIDLLVKKQLPSTTVAAIQSYWNELPERVDVAPNVGLLSEKEGERVD